MKLSLLMLSCFYSPSLWAQSKSEHISFLSSVLMTLFLVFFVTSCFYFWDKKFGISLKFKLIGGISSIVFCVVLQNIYTIRNIDFIAEDIEIIGKGFQNVNNNLAELIEDQMQQKIFFERFLRTSNEEEFKSFFDSQHLILDELKNLDENFIEIKKIWPEKLSQATLNQLITNVDQMKNNNSKYQQLCSDYLQGDKTEIKLKLCIDEAINVKKYTEKVFDSSQVEAKNITANAEAYIDNSEIIIQTTGVGITVYGIIVLFIIWKASIGLITNVKKSSEQLVTTSDSVSTASNSIKNHAEKLSVMTQQQAAAVQEIMATLEEMEQMAKLNSEQTIQSSKKTSNCKDEAANGLKSINEVSDAIHDISSDNQVIIQQIKDSNNKISEIAKIIEEISCKTKVINDIVFQTKLLSFNASVEAARAGENGKGFAVVAEEVGNLAQMSGDASKEIESMLAASVTNVKNIVIENTKKVDVLISNSTSKVKIGLSKVEDCHDLFEQVAKDVADIDGYISEIARANNEESHGITNISIALREIDTGTTEVAHVSRETADASSLLSEESHKLINNSSALKAIVDGNSKAS